MPFLLSAATAADVRGAIVVLDMELDFLVLKSSRDLPRVVVEAVEVRTDKDVTGS